ncbi:MAG: class I SAM-dependent methyltransferase [Hyphomicrobium sp.]
MTGFSADWLSLREPADTAARPPALIDWLVPSLPRDRSVHVLDLATGTGSNLRYLAPRLGGLQQWVLADHDPALLAAMPARLSTWATSNGVETGTAGASLTVQGEAFRCRVDRLQVDLARDLGSIDFSRFDLVTTAALLDLVSDVWLESLVRRCVDATCSVLFALSYDGRIECTPADPLDARVRDLVNGHQRTEKGFGTALGPDAATRTVRLLERLGYEVLAEKSDWRIDAAQPELQAELLKGWASAAAEMAGAERASIDAWLQRRLAGVRDGTSRLVVGHVDVAGRLR